ncbi:NADPH-dependent FMN reductase [Mycena olivaceomarginata]|nr:NADPH-dependent FMN reductase [Mycena olivaceomarginata]
MTSKRVALIIASTRTPRVGPAISKVALGIIVPLLPDHITVTVVDLKDHPLPLYTADPIIPAGIPRPIADTAYADPATNAWSALLALDALYHEWAGKPALVLSYGNRGGGKAAGQLRQVLDGLHMRTCTRGVELAFGEGHDLGGGAIGEGTNNRWRAEDKKEELVAAWGELADLIDTEVPATRRD